MISSEGGEVPTHIAPDNVDAWETYDPFTEDDGTPYNGVLNLIPDDRDSVGDLTRGDLKDIKEWFSAHGPLGVLPARLHDVRLWPRWGESEDVHEGLDRVAINQKSLAVRSGGMEISETLHPTDCPEEEDAHEFDPTPGEPLSEEALQSVLRNTALQQGGLQRPGVTCHQSMMGPTMHATITMGYARFFPLEPEVPQVDSELARRREDPDSVLVSSPRWKALEVERARYPVDMREDDFWNAYAEPLSEILDGIHLLKRLAGFLSDHASLAGDLDSQFVFDRMRINQLLRKVSHDVTPDGEKWTRSRSFNSLLAVYASMMVRDILFDGKPLKRCPCCGRWITGTDDFYGNHANRARQQRHRLREAAEAALTQAEQAREDGDLERAQTATEKAREAVEEHERLNPQGGSREPIQRYRERIEDLLTLSARSREDG